MAVVSVPADHGAADGIAVVHFLHAAHQKKTIETLKSGSETGERQGTVPGLLICLRPWYKIVYNNGEYFTKYGDVKRSRQDSRRKEP